MRMADTRKEDPFDWDEDVVAQVLGAPNCPWTRDPAALIAKAKEELIDGKTLLTFEHVFSGKELMECLDVKPARHKVALAEMIISLRSRSRGYQQWKQNLDRKQSGYPEESRASSIIPQESGPQPGSGPASVGIEAQTPRSEAQPHISDAPLASDDEPYNQKLDVPSPISHLLSKLSPVNDRQTPTSPARLGVPSVTPLPESPDLGAEAVNHDLEQDRSRKRKRVAPTILSTRPQNIGQAFIPTEADTISLPAGTYGPSERTGLPWETSSNGAYLGNGSMSTSMIRSPAGVLSSRIVEEDQSWGTSKANRLPPGRRLAVYKTTKKLFIKNSAQEKLHRQGFIRMRSPSISDDEDVIDIFDIPDDLDEQTLKEMEEERLENEARQGMKERNLSRDRVQSLLDDAISAMTSTWQERKLPKYQRKAYRQWHDARRRLGAKKEKVLSSHRQAKVLGDRIEKLCDEILGQVWQKEADVQNQARCLEQSVEDRLYHVWFADMLESRIEPPKPQTIPKPQRPVPEKLRDLLDDEVLTSSDEEDFIVPDEEPPYVDGGPMDIDEDYTYANYSFDPAPALPVKEESPTFVDLTQIQTPEKMPSSRKKRAYIDLTSPMKPLVFSRPGSKDKDTLETRSRPAESNIAPSLDTLGNIEEIGGYNLDHWVQQVDRWRLVVGLIWKLPHARRTAIFSFIHDKPLDDVWEGSVLYRFAHHPSDPIAEGASGAAILAYDLTKAFVYFFKCRIVKEQRLISLNSKRFRKGIDAAREVWFEPFCAFLNKVAPYFPQDSQIYRLDDLEGTDEGESNDEETLLDGKGALSKRRKAPPKEIIQNKEAVDLRERERQRQVEQEARRQQLRAQIAGFMPRDKTRLIINETKQEHQPFIYVNEEIGQRIMDHQVDGVRFLWNQIVLGAENQQGCLLAHTMGLGKTMQVITLLTTIAEAKSSQDAGVRAQIPQDLRDSQTLILCPPGLVDNWMDELLMWSPTGILGELRKIAATTPLDERFSSVQSWSEGGGVLIIGYSMFKKIISESAESQQVLIEKPNIVVADEAHMIKNPNSQVHQACSRFKTRARIALTGSPLANNVSEYYVMIDWVAENFLGPSEEFNEIYTKPIQGGLWQDSTRSEQRIAFKKLQALKETVAPKVDRKTMNMCLKQHLPQKHEFVISVPPTPLQTILYARFVDGIIAEFGADKSQGQVFSINNNLSLICNHPRCFKDKLDEIQRLVARNIDNCSSFPKSIIPSSLHDLALPDPINPDLSVKMKLLTMILDESRRVGDKVLVFSQSIPTLRYLEALCKLQKRRFCQLNGSTPMETRQDMTKNFNSGNFEVYLISTNAGGVGLNLQGANRVIILDIKYNPVNEQQAVGRAFRIGQTKEVYVYRFVMAGTFEENLQNRHVFKTQLASRVVDQKNPIIAGKRLGKSLHHIEDRPSENLQPFLGKDTILDKMIALDDGKFIRSIVSTDTFEEEEPTVEFTQDERNEVDEWKLRLSNPEEYARIQHQRSLERQAAQAALIATAPARTLPSQGAPWTTAVPLGQTTDRSLPAGGPSSDGARANTHVQAQVAPYVLPAAANEHAQVRD